MISVITDFNLFRTDISFACNILILNTFAFICFRLTHGAQICRSAHQATLLITLAAPKRRTPKTALCAVQMPAGFGPIEIIDEASALHDVRESPPQAVLLLNRETLPDSRIRRAHTHEHMHNHM